MKTFDANKRKNPNRRSLGRRLLRGFLDGAIDAIDQPTSTNAPTNYPTRAIYRYDENGTPRDLNDAPLN